MQQEVKEISEELMKRDVAICQACGAIFENVKNIGEPCPECGQTHVVRWVTSDHSWNWRCQ